MLVELVPSLPSPMSNNSDKNQSTHWFSAVSNKLPSLNTLDQILGLRSWGLILYGALPASLSLLGFLEVKVGTVEKRVPILLVSLLPLLLTFLLVRARQKEWYFTTDYLLTRSLITTLLIVVGATLISGAAGIIRGKYVFSLNNITDEAHKTAMAESFLLGIASLVLSSTLFATILTKGADLPGLPSSTFVSLISGIRQQLIAIQISSIWQKYDPQSDDRIFEELQSVATKLTEEFAKVRSQPSLRLPKRSLVPIQTDFSVFVKSISEIKDGKDSNIVVFRWKIRFADFASLQDENLDSLKNDRESILQEYEALQRLKRLRLGG